MGIGFGGGVIRHVPLTNSLNVNLEASFMHRNLYSEEGDSIKTDKTGNQITYNYWKDENEFVLRIIPVLVQFTPFEFPLYVAVGFQLDFPILPKFTITEEYKDGRSDEYAENYEDRHWYDLGMVWGIGYNITDRFSFNLRSVVGFTSVTGKRADARTPVQYGLSVAFF
jgi:hypothetical protein